MKSGGGHRRWFVRIISAPMRVLCRARDLYVRTLSDYADRMGSGSMGCSMGQYPPLPRSFSAASSRSDDHDDDLRELIRAASARSYGGRIDIEAILGRRDSGAVRKLNLGSRVLPKSASVRMGRIDEEEPCEFGRDVAGAARRERLFPRSRSCAVARTTVECAVEAKEAY